MWLIAFCLDDSLNSGVENVAAVDDVSGRCLDSLLLDGDLQLLYIGAGLSLQFPLWEVVQWVQARWVEESGLTCPELRFSSRRKALDFLWHYVLVLSPAGRGIAFQLPLLSSTVLPHCDGHPDTLSGWSCGPHERSVVAWHCPHWRGPIIAADFFDVNTALTWLLPTAIQRSFLAFLE